MTRGSGAFISMTASTIRCWPVEEDDNLNDLSIDRLITKVTTRAAGFE